MQRACLNNVVLAGEDVRGAEVAVDVVLRLEVLHAFAAEQSRARVE